MTPNETGERRNDLKSQLIERLHNPLQLRILVIGTVLLAGYGAVYVPLTTQIAKTAQALDRERKMAVLAQSLEHLQTQCARFAKRLPQQADSKEWMQYMHEGIRTFPLKLSKLDCLAPRQIGPYKVMVLTIELEGSLFDLDRFLRWIETNPRFLRADEITIALAAGKERGKPKGSENKDDMTMKLTVLGMAG
jgi:hypothetical protein